MSGDLGKRFAERMNAVAADSEAEWQAIQEKKSDQQKLDTLAFQSLFDALNDEVTAFNRVIETKQRLALNKRNGIGSISLGNHNQTRFGVLDGTLRLSNPSFRGREQTFRCCLSDDAFSFHYQETREGIGLVGERKDKSGVVEHLLTLALRNQ